MIELTTDQLLFTDKKLAVKTGGSYNPTDLVEVYNIYYPEQITAYYAQFIIDGTYP